MELFHSSAANKQQAFKDTMRSFRSPDHDNKVLLTYESKMWLFSKRANSTITDIRPIHGLVVGIVYPSSPGKEDSISYAVSVTWRGNMWHMMTHTKNFSDAGVFCELGRLASFMEQAEDHFLNMEGAKGMFIIPVTITGEDTHI